MENKIMNDLTETTFEEFKPEDIVEAVADPVIMEDIEIKNAKTFVIAGITIMIIGTTIYIIKNKDQIKSRHAERKTRKIGKQIAKLEALGYHVFKKETVEVEVKDED